MVLQRGANAVVYGTADPNELVNVTLLLHEKTIDSLTAKTTADNAGNWKIAFSKLDAGGPYSLKIQGKNEVVLNDVFVGEVWVCSGQSNMQMELKACFEPKAEIEKSKNAKLRLYSVPRVASPKPLDTVKAKWVECNPETVPAFSAVAYYFGRDLQKALNVPVGLIHSSWGGTVAEAWATPQSLAGNDKLNKEIVEKYNADLPKALENYPKQVEKYKADLAKYREAADKAKQEGKPAPNAPRAPVDPTKNQNSPSALYNGMIHPLQPFVIRGAIWYQGEANAGRADQYKTLFPVMIQSWRDSWKNPNMPFLFVQLAPYQKIEKEPTDTGWTRLCEAQFLTSKTVKNTGMAVITDVGDEKDIHPKKKEPAGARLALAARALVYGEPIEYSGPVYESVAFDGNQAVLSFSHVGKGLEARGQDGTLTGFTIAAADKVFHNASATIKGDKVVVASDKVAKPAAVRFGWANYPVVNLWNKDGLPASPFRTDDWAPVSTTTARTTDAAPDKLNIILTVNAGQHGRKDDPVAVSVAVPKALATVGTMVLKDDKQNVSTLVQLTNPGLLTAPVSLGAGYVQRELHFLVTLKAGQSLTLNGTLTTNKAELAKATSFHWKDGGTDHIDLSFGDRPVMSYVHPTLDDSSEKNREATFKVWHHLYTPDGSRLVTKDVGGQYTHHRALFYGFMKVTYETKDGPKTVDIWHCKDNVKDKKVNETHQSHDKVLASEEGPIVARQRVLIGWHGLGKEVFANEEREMTVYNVPGGTLVQFASKLTPVKGTVKVDGDPQHAGFHFRADDEVSSKTSKQTIFVRPDGDGAPARPATGIRKLRWGRSICPGTP